MQTENLPKTEGLKFTVDQKGAACFYSRQVPLQAALSYLNYLPTASPPLVS